MVSVLQNIDLLFVDTSSNTTYQFFQYRWQTVALLKSAGVSTVPPNLNSDQLQVQE